MPEAQSRTTDYSAAPGSPDPGDYDTTTGILAAMRADGVTAQFMPGQESATIKCAVCDSTSAAGAFEVVDERRLEGTSDPDDMVLIVAARCPVCHVTGALVLAYGPEASGTDIDLVSHLSGRA